MNNDNKKALIEDAKYGAFIAAVAGLLRIIYLRAFISALPNALHPSNDARSYWELSLRIYREGWLLPNDGPFYQAPLYPYTLSVLHQFGIHSISSILWLQAGLGVVNTLMTFILARAFLSRPAATAAALLFSFCHLSLFLESKLLAATLGTTLLLCFALCAMRWLKTRAMHMLAFAGFFFGLTLLCRPNQIFLFPFLFAFFIWQGRKHKSLLMTPLIFFVATLIAVAPSFLRNGLVGGDWVPFTANAGVTLFMGNNPQAQGGLAPIEGLSNDIEDQHTQSIELASQQAGKALSPSQASNYWVKKTLAWAAGHPIAFIILEAKKLLWCLYYAPPAVNVSTHFESAFIGWLSLLAWPTFFIVAFALIALPLLPRAGDKGWFLLALFGGYLLLSLTYYASDRFLAAMAPFFAIQAMIAVTAYLQSKRSALANDRMRWTRWIIISFLLACNPYLSWNAKNETGMGFYNLGVFYEEQGESADAFDAYKEAYKYASNNPALLLNLGVLYARQGDLQRSTKLFERVLELNPANQDAKRNLEINRRRMN
ncbi:glycosyltransferase family 39 protein [bacterium]|nr:glycosyltransferase family 39 protein [bacterium]